jgi:hypothetical protein
LSYIYTTYFGLTAVREQTPNSNDWAATYWNWITVDSMLNGLVLHNHTGGLNLSNPSGDVTVAALDTGGTLSAGKTYYFCATLIDEFGMETAKSSVTEVTTQSVISPPSTPTYTASTDLVEQATAGALAGGTYYYKISYVKGGGETTASSPVTVDVPYDQTYAATIHFTSLDTAANGATSIFVYRKTGTGNYVKLIEITVTSRDYYTDNNTASPDCDKQPNTTNTTNAQNSITVDATSITNYSDAEYLKVYATDTLDSSSAPYFSGATLVSTVDINAATLALAFTITSGSFTTGNPPESSQCLPAPAKVDLTSEVSGILPAANTNFKGIYDDPTLLPSGVAGDIAFVLTDGAATPITIDTWYLYDTALATPAWVQVGVKETGTAVADVEESATPTAVELKLNELLGVLRTSGIISS